MPVMECRPLQGTQSSTEQSLSLCSEPLGLGILRAATLKHWNQYSAGSLKKQVLHIAKGERELVLTHRGDPLSLSPLLKHITCCHSMLTPTGWSLWTPSKCQWMSLGSIFFHMEKCKNTFASWTLPDQAPFCQTAPWLPSVTQQPNMMGYWWGGSAPISVPPASPFDVVGQHHRTGGITFGAASYHCLQWSLLHPQPDLRQPMLQPVSQFNHTISWRCLWAWKRGCFLLFFFSYQNSLSVSRKVALH